MGKDVDFFKNSSVIVLTGDLFDSNIITNKYQEMLNKKIRETQIASEISIVNMLEIMPSLILAAEKLKIKN
jgi:DNA repair exonuclease SbcCD nuclease subunit